jgi:fermentation-respiration switch protein FrsA (DUF1100 family)
MLPGRLLIGDIGGKGLIPQVNAADRRQDSVPFQCYHRAMAIVRWVLIIGVCGYALVVAVLYFAQRAMLFPGTALHITPAAADMPEAQEVVLDTSDGEKLIAWHVPPRGDRPVVIYFHGNGEIVPWRAKRHRATIANGTGLIAVNFRGYGGSTGTPTEEGLHRDAAAAYAFAVARYPAQRIVLWGHSLGTGVAVKLASERPVAKLILEAPYTSTVDVAATKFPFVPVRWLMKDQLHSDQWIGKVHVPLLIMHGARDDVIPIRFGERLFALANEPKRFIRYDQGGHIDLDDYGAGDAARAFIAEKP